MLLECKLTKADLKKIMAWEGRELTADDLFVFNLRMSDNTVDENGRRFTRDCLRSLSHLLEGRVGFFNNDPWHPARVLRTTVNGGGSHTGVSSDDPAYYMDSLVYMLRTQENANIIDEIENGLKATVDLSCTVGKETCSICGQDLSICRHKRWKFYKGKMCVGELDGAISIYGWTFRVTDKLDEPEAESAATMQEPVNVSEKGSDERKAVKDCLVKALCEKRMAAGLCGPNACDVCPVHETFEMLETAAGGIKEAMFFSVWDDGTIIGSPCKVNVETKEVFDIKLVSDGIEGLDSLEREYIVLNDDEDEYQYPVFDSDPEDGNFWYN